MKIAQELQSLLKARTSSCNILHVLGKDPEGKNFAVAYLTSGCKDYLQKQKDVILVITNEVYSEYGIWSYLAFPSLDAYLNFKSDGSDFPNIFDSEYPTFDVCRTAALADIKQNKQLLESIA